MSVRRQSRNSPEHAVSDLDRCVDTCKPWCGRVWQQKGCVMPASVCSITISMNSMNWELKLFWELHRQNDYRRMLKCSSHWTHVDVCMDRKLSPHLAITSRRFPCPSSSLHPLCPGRELELGPGSSAPSLTTRRSIHSQSFFAVFVDPQ